MKQAPWAFVMTAAAAAFVACADPASTPAEGAPPGTDPATGAPGNEGTTAPGGSDIAGPNGGDDGTADAPPPLPPAEDLGEGDGKDVVSLGDSYMRLPNLVQQPGTEGVDLSLAELGRQYRTYAFTGGSFLTPVGVKNGVIPGQLSNAIKADPDIKTVIVAGGGNDLAQNTPCRGAKTVTELSAACRQELDAIIPALDAFVANVAKAGVKDLVWVGYGPTATTGDKIVEGAIAYLRADRQAKCVATNPALGLRCHYIDNFAAKVPTRDGFHPTSEGYDMVAKAVLDRLKAVGARR